ncbi:MAG TPA: NTP transferase domain-containing protein, partial [Candidatus Dormibacteraeota bacterium]|nr:NTP transferase domain-containing protein [Candidatus Dormibacteraeota bacterium]
MADGLGETIAIGFWAHDEAARSIATIRDNRTDLSLPLSAVILAAGHGTRMRSRIPKVLHPICGRPMIDWVLAAVTDAGVKDVKV